MDLHKGFEKKGFLSAGITNGIARLRTENAAWFKLAEDTNAIFMHTATTAMNSVHTTSMSPEAVAVRVLLRSCGTLQGIILLTERGMVAEGRTLARSLIENAFCVAALHDKPALFIKMLKEDSDASLQLQRKFIIAESLIASGAARTKLQAAIDANEKSDIMSPKKIARLGPLLKQYLYYQRLSDDAAHASAKSLHRHVSVQKTPSGWNYKWGAGDRDENAATLHHTILAALPIGIGITAMLKDTDGNAAFAELANRFQSMPPVPII